MNNETEIIELEALDHEFDEKSGSWLVVIDYRAGDLGYLRPGEVRRVSGKCTMSFLRHPGYESSALEHVTSVREPDGSSLVEMRERELRQDLIFYKGKVKNIRFFVNKFMKAQHRPPPIHVWFVPISFKSVNTAGIRELECRDLDNEIERVETRLNSALEEMERLRERRRDVGCLQEEETTTRENVR